MRVTLRPIREDDLERLESKENGEVRSPFDDFGFRGVGALRRAFETDGFLPEGGERGRLAVMVDGELAGTVSWNSVRHGPNPASRAFNIGIVLFPEQQRRGNGGVAMRALAEYLFDKFDVARIEGSTDVDNVPTQRAAEKAGFKREGVLRCAQFRNGAHHDLVLYSLTRADITQAVGRP